MDKKSPELLHSGLGWFMVRLYFLSAAANASFWIV
ncbi:MAG: hypothetical protein RLZZ94_1176, partial [Bacteroidota bacterium]